MNAQSSPKKRGWRRVSAPTPEQVAEVRSAIETVVDGKAAHLARAYYNPRISTYGSVDKVLFAGKYFDELTANDANHFTVGDLAAASLLDVRFGPHVVLELLERSACDHLLSQVPTDLTLWDATEDDLSAVSAVGRLWTHLDHIHDVGATRASKLLARKRPHLMPILDSVVVDALHLGTADKWLALRLALDPSTRRRIDALADAAISQGASRPSTLRLLDVVTWMTWSSSRQAVAVRNSLERRAGYQG